MDEDLKVRLGQLRAALLPRVQKLKDPYPAVVLFFSVSDGRARARIVTGAGASLEAAWQKGLAELRRELRASRLKGRWLRIDWVKSVEPTTWGDFRLLLKRT